MEKWDIDDLRYRMLGLESLVHSVWRAFDTVIPEHKYYDEYNEAMQGLYAIYQYLNDLNNESRRNE